MKIKVSELRDEKLDYWVAKAENKKAYVDDGYCLVEDDDVAMMVDYSPSTTWFLAGPIIEREKITIQYIAGHWQASKDRFLRTVSDGETALIAAMRCFVASKFGEEVEE